MPFSRTRQPKTQTVVLNTQGLAKKHIILSVDLSSSTPGKGTVYACECIPVLIMLSLTDAFPSPILTYGGQGTNKPGVKAADHAIIYTGNVEPQPLPGENGIHKRSVKVESTDPRGKLAPESRVNYSKVYTVEHNVKVCFIGRVHNDSKATFFTDFDLTFSRRGGHYQG